MDSVSLLLQSKKIEQFLQATKTNLSQTVFGLTEGEIGVLLALVNQKIVLLSHNEQQLYQLQKQLLALKKQCFLLPIVQEQPIFSLSGNSDGAYAAMRALYEFSRCETGVLLISAAAALQTFPSLKQIQSSIIPLSVGQVLSLTALNKQLSQIGYEKTERVSSPGEFSIRGDIVDVWLEESEHVIRLDFFGNELESIKEINQTMQTVVQKLEEITLFPRTTMLFEAEETSLLIERMEAAWMAETKNKHTSLVVSETIADVKQHLEAGSRTQNLAFASVFTKRQSVLDMFPHAHLVVCEASRVKEKAEEFYQNFVQGVQHFVESGTLLNAHKQFMLAPSRLFALEKSQGKTEFKSLYVSDKLFESDQVIEFVVSGRQKYIGKREWLLADIKKFVESGKQVILFAGSKGNANFLKSDLEFANLNEHVFVSDQTLPLSALFSSEQVILIGTEDLFHGNDVTVAGKDNKHAAFFLPKVGDFVVHSIHGVGKCIALERLKFSDFEKDYIVLEYAQGDKLFVPSEQANVISAFRGGEGEPKLNKLGGTEFFKSKQKVRASVKAMAFDLAKLYKDRENRKGIAFPPDTWMQKELEDSFEFEETPDQTLAIQQVTQDMESERVMDRLICGDVGFGKTEVAIRAIFKAISHGKQVAFLCPTTILAEQHFMTCSARLGQFGVRIKALSRFKTIKEQKQILQDLKEHKIDLIIGTHRLLSKDVVFADLGLLVLDEEQRFGVSHKEQIKHTKRNIDTLAMSATPIPRTLHMALSGIRDISVIETPPKSRLPVITTVTEFSDSLLQYAGKRELDRGGQVLLVVNRILQTERYASKLRELLPESRVAVAHGQMPAAELEDVMLKLSRKELDILVATTLIENGIDLPKANTLFVIDAGNLGLSQLYQLRGRVGRSDRQAYAYLTFPGKKDLSDASHKRLTAIGEFTELGSGFKIAMRDLEIRGAGDVLGSMQHGHMQAIGYDMYCKILAEVASELKGEEIDLLKEIVIEVNIDAFMPLTFVSSSEERIAIFNKISVCSSLEEERNLMKGLVEMYGELPKPLKNLISIARLKNAAQQIGVKKVKLSQSVSELVFHAGDNRYAEGILQNVQKHFASCVMKGGENIVIQFKNLDASMAQKIDFATKFCASCKTKPTA